MLGKIKEKFLTIVKTQEDVQQDVDELFPFEYKALPGVVVTLSHPKVWFLDEKNQVELMVDVSVKALLVGEHHGSVNICGQVVYDEVDRKIVLKNPELLKLNIPSVSDKYIDTINAVLNIIMKKHLSDLFAFSLPEGIKYSLVKGLTIDNRTVRISLL
ncbi:DUF1439 domain-containing protein [Pseudaeromonas sp. ZJS20]|uniref:DUF1439 domain-containing protein n=1 Tax=Pseudaeromonas aegiceratis TaxID=3153928 RepID=UPI00390CC458